MSSTTDERAATPVHRAGCDCIGSDVARWTCARCGRACAPCWGGYVDDGHNDVCGVCHFQESAYPERVRGFAVDADDEAPLSAGGYAKERTRALGVAAARNVNFMPIHASLDGEVGRWIVIAIYCAVLDAWTWARSQCAEEGHSDWRNMTSGRCVRCGEKAGRE